MRLGLFASLVVHTGVAAALALFGARAARPEPDRPLSVAIRMDDGGTVEPLPDDPPFPEAPPVTERWEFPEEVPLAAEIDEAPREIGTGGSLPPPAVRLAKPLRHRAARAATVAAPAPALVPAPARAPAAAPRAPQKLEPPRLLADLSLPARYPERARRLGIEGDVLLRIAVSIDGAVTGVEIAASSGHEELDRAAADAAAAWRFEPARRDGKAVAYDVRVPVEFRLADA